MFYTDNEENIEKEEDVEENSDQINDLDDKDANKSEEEPIHEKEEKHMKDKLKDKLKGKTCAKKDKQECKQKDEKLEKIKELQETLEFKQKSLDNMKDENYKLSNQVDALKDRLQRISSEYENYRNRTAKEKEALYDDACEDIFKNIFPVVDNLERAANIEGSLEDIKKGVEMTLKQVQDSFSKLGIEEIPTDCAFDPNFHNAVMHVEDENYGENEIVDVLQKGYKKGNKVLRYSMVKVAN